MKILKVILPMSILILFVLSLYWLVDNKQPDAVRDVISIEMGGGLYTPQNVEIKKGTKVVFKNSGTQDRWPASNLHPTHGIYPEFDPEAPVKPNQEWEFVFDIAGTWKYHDHIDPSIIGQIIVTD